MRTFAQKPSATRQATPSQSGGPYFGRSPDSLLHEAKSADLAGIKPIPRFAYDFSRISVHPGPAACVQRKPAASTSDHLHTAPEQPHDTEDMAAPAIVHEALAASGDPLDRTARAFMEPRFGHDFSSVKVHSGIVAAKSAHALGARAYTVGRDIAFGANQ